MTFFSSLLFSPCSFKLLWCFKNEHEHKLLLSEMRAFYAPQLLTRRLEDSANLWEFQLPSKNTRCSTSLLKQTNKLYNSLIFSIKYLYLGFAPRPFLGNRIFSPFFPKKVQFFPNIFHFLYSKPLILLDFWKKSIKIEPMIIIPT